MACASHELKIPLLKTVCSQFIEKTANSGNYLQYALIADRCGLRLSKELGEQFLAANCANISKDMSPRNAVHINDVASNLSKNESEIFENIMKSVESISGAESTLLLNSYQALYRSFVSFEILLIIFDAFFTFFKSSFQLFIIFHFVCIN